jgi:hypothetical protein
MEGRRMTDNDLDLIGNLDARAWAARFVEKLETNPTIVEYDCMVTWFANTIMAGLDHNRNVHATAAVPSNLYKPRPTIITAEGPLDDWQNIWTIAGTMRAAPGDYIVTGVKAERYPVRPDIFHATYEPVDD